MTAPVPFSDATHELTKLLQRCGRPAIFNLLQQAIVMGAISGKGITCPVCTAPRSVHPGIGICDICRWSVLVTPTTKARREHLLTVGCLALYGAASIPALRATHINPVKIIQAFMALLDVPESCDTLQHAMECTLYQLGPLDGVRSLSSSTIPWNSPDSGEKTALDIVDPLKIVIALRMRQDRAYDAFRSARWPDGVHCPYCDSKAITAGHRHLGVKGLQLVRRWRCLSPQGRQLYNSRQWERRTQDHRRWMFKRRLRQDGCGKYFSDTTETEFADSKVLLSDWFFLLYYGPRALKGLLAAGVNPAACCRMLEKLLHMADTEQQFWHHLRAEVFTRYVGPVVLDVLPKRSC